MILDEIIFNKRQEVTALKVHLDPTKTSKIIKELLLPRKFHPKKFSLIAEIKKASPSAGVIVDKFNPAEIAKAYEKNGAAAISVLTDEKYFQGKIEYLEKVKKTVDLPILRKDFIIDESQIYESRLIGADIILLIARILSDEQLKSFLTLAKSLHLACLVEVRDESEVERALQAGAEMIGINNRDLDTLQVDFQTTLRLISKYPALKDKTIVSESGISSAEQVAALKEAGVVAILVGESLLRSADIGAKIRELIG